MNSSNIKVITLVILILTGIVMTSGCIDRVWDIVEVNDGEEANVDYSKYDNESADNETGNTVESDKNSEKTLK